MERKASLKPEPILSPRESLVKGSPGLPPKVSNNLPDLRKGNKRLETQSKKSGDLVKKPNPAQK